MSSKGILSVLLISLFISFIAGCGNFFDEKSTEMISRKTIADLSIIEPVKNTHIPKDIVYQRTPEIVDQNVGGSTEFKLFYFCKYHTAEQLKVFVKEQFATTLFDAKGKSTQISDYTVSAMAPTNQLIIRCPLKEDAESVLQFLEMVDVQPVQVRIDCLISEVYADVTMDWATTLEIENLFGAGVKLGGIPGQPAFPGAALRDAARASFGLKTGFEKANTGFADNFNVLVDMLVSRGYLKILMNPSLEVVNGQTAEIMTSEHVPLDQITNVHPVSGVLTTQTKYEDVVDSLKITPHVFADGYIGLETMALIGSKSTPEGVKQIPIVTKRQVMNKENRIRQGESLIIGGITKTEKRSVVRGVPFLKDLPIIGILFSSKDFEERGKEVLFIITPTISTYGQPNAEITEMLQKKHETIEIEGEPHKLIGDPFGSMSNEKNQTKNEEMAPTKLEIDKQKTSDEDEN